MTKTIEMWETYWYLALQDGRDSDTDYDTEEEAKAALKKIPKEFRRSMCVMSGRRRLM